jgi:hypothetical protein
MDSADSGDLIASLNLAMAHANSWAGLVTPACFETR